MEDPAFLNDTLDKRWRSICKVLLHQEVGPLSDFSAWLKENTVELAHRKSAISGKEVTYYIREYAQDSKFASFEEAMDTLGREPLNVNSIKDIDSLFDAVRERAYYAGNEILGNSSYVSRSSSVIDSFYVLESGFVSDSKYVVHSNIVKYSEDAFGCEGIAECKHALKVTNAGHKDNRCFELWRGDNSSDCYYSHNMSNCQECMFSFNLKGGNHCIGNLRLAPDKYLRLKEKLLSEIAEELRGKKRLPTLIELVGKSKSRLPREAEESAKNAAAERAWDSAPLDKALGRTSELLLGQRLDAISKYEGWMKEHIHKRYHGKSFVSSKDIAYSELYDFGMYPVDRLVKEEEAEVLGKFPLPQRIIEEISWKSIPGAIGPIAYFTPEIRVGKNENVKDCQTFHSSHALSVFTMVYSKYSAFSDWTRTSEHVFGSCFTHESSFCLKCFYSKKLSRCFEVDSSRNCTDCYFCHNCENVRGGILCFNAKNLSYAICNVEVGREEFERVKKIMLDWVNRGIRQDARPPMSIFDVGAMHKRLGRA